MYFSDKVKEEINKRYSTDVEVPRQDFINTLKQHGIAVSMIGDKILVGYSDVIYMILVGDVIKFYYTLDMLNGVIVLNPHIEYEIYETNDKVAFMLKEKVLEIFEKGRIAIELSEKIVQLPLPAWIRHGQYLPNSDSEISSAYMLKSEAEELWNEFVTHDPFAE